MFVVRRYSEHEYLCSAHFSSLGRLASIVIRLTDCGVEQKGPLGSEYHEIRAVSASIMFQGKPRQAILVRVLGGWQKIRGVNGR